MARSKVNNTSKPRIHAFHIINAVIFIVICLIVLIPIWKVVVDSLDLKTAYGMRFWPKEFGLDGYVSVFTNPTLYHPLIIPVITTVGGTFLGLLLSTLTAYVLIQYDLPGRTFISGYLLFTMVFTGGMIPTYLVVRALHLTNTLWAVTLIPAINIYDLVLMRNFFEGIPSSLFESAEIDGCGRFRNFFTIILPLYKSGLSTLAINNDVMMWNEFAFANTFLQTPAHKTLPLALGQFKGEHALDIPIILAVLTLSVLPMIILFIIFQDKLVKGMMAGAVKG